MCTLSRFSVPGKSPKEVAPQDTSIIINRFIHKRVFVVNQALVLILCGYKNLSSVHLKSQVECKFEHKASQVQ